MDGFLNALIEYIINLLNSIFGNLFGGFLF